MFSNALRRDPTTELFLPTPTHGIDMASNGFLDHLCEHATGIRYVFIVSMLSILVLLWSLTVVQTGTGTYYIALIQLGTFALLAVLSFVLMIACHRIDPPEKLEV